VSQDWTRENQAQFEAWKRLMPSSLLSRTQRTVWTPMGLMTLIFCSNCGASGGAITAPTEFVHYLCDDCKHLAAGLPEIPEPIVRPQEG